MAGPTIPGSKQPMPEEEPVVIPEPSPAPVEQEPNRTPAAAPVSPTPVAAPIPIGGTVEASSYDPSVRPMPTVGEGMQAGVEEAFNNWFSMSLARKGSVQELNSSGAKKVLPDELNQMFPSLARPFSEPMTMTAASWIAQQQEERQARLDLMERQSSTLGYAASKGAELAGGFADPVGLAAALLTGGAMSVGMKAIGLAAPATLVGRTAFGITENLIGSVPQAVANYQADRAEQYTTTAGDAAMGAAQGAVVGTIGFKVLGWGLGRVSRALSPAANYAASRVGLAQVLEGKRVNLDFMDTAFMRAAKGTAPERPLAGQAAYEFRPISSAAEVRGKPFYAVDGVAGVLTDNPGVANAAASGPAQGAARSIKEVNLEAMNLISLQGELHPDLEDAMLPALRDITGSMKGASELARSSSPGELFSLIRSAIQEGKVSEERGQAMMDAFREKGIDGVIYNPAERMADAAESPQNSVMLFKDLPESAVKRTFSSDASLIEDKLSPSEIEQAKEHAASNQSDIDFDPREFEAFKQTMGEDVGDPQPSQAEKLSQETIDSVKEMSEQGFIDPEVRKEIDAIVEERRAAEIEEDVTKQGYLCLKANG